MHIDVSGTMDQSWGQSCTDGEPLVCNIDADCVSTAPQSVRLQCVRSVCVLKMSENPSCYSHADCASLKKMCSGDGKCVESILQVENDLKSDDIEFELYTKQCATATDATYPVEQYDDMYGASPWETIPDILKMYGMCSYHDWYEYLEFIDSTNTTARPNPGMCGELSKTLGCEPLSYNVLVSRWWDTQRPHAEATMQSLWDTQKFRVKAHPCDKVFITFTILFCFVAVMCTECMHCDLDNI